MPPSRPLLAAAAIAAATALTLSGCAVSPARSRDQIVNVGTIVHPHQHEPPYVFGGWMEEAYLSYQVLGDLTSLTADHKVVRSWPPRGASPLRI